MARIKFYDKNTQKWVYADKAFCVGTGGGTETTTKQSSGSIVAVKPVVDTPIQVVSKITGWDTGFSAAKYLSLRHVKGKNLFDFVSFLGGAGATVESNGLNGVVNANGTITITGTNTVESNVAFKTTLLPNRIGVGVFPPGTYTISPGLLLEIKSPETEWASLGHGLTGTFTVDEPFWIRNFWFLYNGVGTVVNETRPLYLVAGSAPLSTGYAYDGSFYMVTLTNAISDGEFDWQTGELHDSDGNLVETVTSPIGNGVTAYDGINTFISNTGETFVTYTSTGSSDTSGDSAGGSNTFNPDAWGLPVLHLNGSRTGISKDNAVTLSWIYGMQEGTCTLKWQGSSSIKWPKKNYTIKFEDPILINEAWGAQKKYCLKANYIDFSHARNLVCAKLWGQVVKCREVQNTTLNALVNAGAVDGFPICLVINGEYQGIYTWNIPKDGWMFGMTGAASDEAIVCAGGADDTAAVLFQKADVVLDTDFDMEYAPDENNTAWIKESLDTLIAACISSDGTDLDTTIAQYLDWDSVIDFICFTVLINGFDCLSKNYLLATYGGGKWFFSGYDMDSTFGLHWDGTYIHTVRGAYNNRASIGEFCRLHRAFELVKLYKKDALKRRYTELRASVLSEDNVVTEFANFIGSIPKGVYDHECTIWPSIPSTAVNSLHQISDFYRRKCIDIDAEMNAL